jgi:hypothetical protein
MVLFRIPPSGVALLLGQHPGHGTGSGALPELDRFLVFWRREHASPPSCQIRAVLEWKLVFPSFVIEPSLHRAVFLANALP